MQYFQFGSYFSSASRSCDLISVLLMGCSCWSLRSDLITLELVGRFWSFASLPSGVGVTACLVPMLLWIGFTWLAPSVTCFRFPNSPFFMLAVCWGYWQLGSFNSGQSERDVVWLWIEALWMICCLDLFLRARWRDLFCCWYFSHCTTKVVHSCTVVFLYLYHQAVSSTDSWI